MPAVRFKFTSHGREVGFLAGPLVNMTKVALTRTAEPSTRKPREPVTYDMVKYIREVKWENILTQHEYIDKAKSMMEYLGIALAFNFMMSVSKYTLGVHALMHDDVWFVGKPPHNQRYTCIEIRERGIMGVETDTNVEKQLVCDLVTWCGISGGRNAISS